MDLFDKFLIQKKISKDIYNYLNSLIDKVNNEKLSKEITEKLEKFYIRLQDN